MLTCQLSPGNPRFLAIADCSQSKIAYNRRLRTITAMYMTSNEIRKTFRDFFEEMGHTAVPSSSLVPVGDETLLFTNAGMVQFKDTFLGIEKRPYSRAVTVQKVMRVSGKHNDFENVGPSPRHHTFFEMLGNFSFGDYFKKEAIRFAWDLLTQVWGLEPSRLWFTVFAGDAEVPADEEAIRYWQEVGAPAERILRFGRKDNFWQMGETGPCGPNSEIHYYRGEHPEDPQYNRKEFVNGDGEETIEIWNLVFMQFNRFLTSEGKYTLEPLPRPSVDTGAGLERVAQIMQGKFSNYETDLFMPIIERTRELLGQPPGDYGIEKRGVSYRVIADHARAVTFLIADGVNPTNDGRGYITRMILRRAARHGQLLGFTEPFLDKVIPTVIEEMGEEYPEIVRNKGRILHVAREEEEKFLQTMRIGERYLNDLIADLKAKSVQVIPGNAAFRLHDTYGYQLDLTREVARENSMIVDEEAFHAAMKEAAERSRRASAFGKGDDASVKLYRNVLETLKAQGKLPEHGVVYDPYGGTKIETEVVGLLRDGLLVNELGAGQTGQLVTAASCFYVESGGQISDTGTIRGKDWEFRVEDTRQPVNGLVVHSGEMMRGVARVEDPVASQVDADRRLNIMRNHTATHLVHAALRDVLGKHVQQAGSLVAPDRLRFDFTHNRPVSAPELQAIEAKTNETIFADYLVEPYIMPYKEAINKGAMALFTEKYGDTVRMMEIDGISRELCGGTHVQHTGQIGVFHIISESSIGSGVRRIEAVTGPAAYREFQKGLTTLEQIADELRATPNQVENKVASLLEQLESKDKEIARLQREFAKRHAENVGDVIQQVDGVRLITQLVQAQTMDLLREQSDYFKNKIGSGVVAVGAVINGKPNMVVTVTPDLVERGFDARKIVSAAAPLMGGGGGGKPSLAQAGGKDPAKLQDALQYVGLVIATKAGE